MGFLSSINHLLNFVAPALVVAVLLVLAGRIFMRKRSAGRGLVPQFAVVAAVGCAVLAAGLIVLGRDGKMLTYAALVAGCATAQWWVLRGWR